MPGRLRVEGDEGEQGESDKHVPILSPSPTFAPPPEAERARARLRLSFMRGIHLTSKTFHCPDIRDQADVEDVQVALSAAPGLEGAEVDWVAKTVSARLANPEAAEDVRQRLADAGFPPEE
jgi:hypothetical protein